VSPYGKEREWLHETEDVPVYSNVLPPVLGLIGIGVVVCAMWLLGPINGGSDEGLTHCVSIANEQARLACYDQIAAPHQPARGALAPVQTRPHEGSQ
jgi:hypothetical protein